MGGRKKADATGQRLPRRYTARDRAKDQAAFDTAVKVSLASHAFILWERALPCECIARALSQAGLTDDPVGWKVPISDSDPVGALPVVRS